MRRTDTPTHGTVFQYRGKKLIAIEAPDCTYCLGEDGTECVDLPNCETHGVQFIPLDKYPVLRLKGEL